MRPVRLRVLAIGAAAAALALPSAVAAATATDSNGTCYGSVESIDSGAASAVQEQVWITIQDGRVTGFQFPVDMHCADGSVDNSGINSVPGAGSSAALSGSHFSVTVGARELGSGQIGRLTGTITGSSITGRVSERGHTYTDGGGGSVHWRVRLRLAPAGASPIV